MWASGNGGLKDDCGCDGYVGSIYTVAIASATLTGGSPYYGEGCSAIFATTYSGTYNSDWDEPIVSNYIFFRVNTGSEKKNPTYKSVKIFFFF